MASEESQAILEEIAELITPRIEESWEWAKVDAQVDDERANFVISYLDTDGNTKQMEIERAIEIIPDLSDRFTQLQTATADESKGPWFHCQYTVHSDRRFETEFSWEPPEWASESGE